MECRHPSPSFENITRNMVRAVRCDSRDECLDDEDENGCESDLGIVAGELTIGDNTRSIAKLFQMTVYTC